VERFREALERLNMPGRGTVFSAPDQVLRHHDRSNDVPNLSREQRVALWTPSFVDWQVLQSTDALVVSRSGFSETAAWFTGVPYVRFRDKVKNCTLRTVTSYGTVPLVWYG
jgi:hypothetical protein